MGSFLGLVESAGGGMPGTAVVTGVSSYAVLGAIEVCGWIVLLGLGTKLLLRARHLRSRIAASTWVLLFLALATRVAVPWVTYNWYFGVGNLQLGASIFSKSTTYLPFPNRLVGFHLGLGFQGIVVLNVFLGVVSVLLLRHVARKAGLGERVSFVLAFLLALTPMYVRLSASDTSQVTLFFLWLVSTAAFAAVRDGGGTSARVALLLATALACPIRLESAVMMVSVPLFVGAGLDGWRNIAMNWRRYLGFWVGLTAGWAVTLWYHGQAIGVRLGGPSLMLLTSFLFVPLRVVGLVNLWIVAFLPLLYAAPILYEMVGCWRTRDWQRLVDTFAPAVVLSIPFALGFNPIITDLSSSSYNIIYVVFTLSACAQGLVRMYDDYRTGVLWKVPWKRALAVALAVPLLWYSFWVPYRWTYVFQEEHAFLDHHLPSHPATILTIWDGRTVAGDWDCSLALPYPPFVASRPDIQWIVLSADSLDPAVINALDFDYYYPGTLVLLDSETPTPWSLAEFAPASELERMQPDRQRLRQLQEVDRMVRQQFALTPVTTEQVPARWEPLHANGCTGVAFGYPGSKVELTIFGRGKALPPD